MSMKMTQKILTNPQSFNCNTAHKLNEKKIKNLRTKTIDENSCTKNLGYVILKKIYSELNISEFLNQKQKNLKTI